MTKIKAVLDQETWVAVDVPDEFQAIVEALSSTDSPVNSFESTATDGTANVVESEASAGQDYLSLNESVENSADYPNEIAVAGQESTAESTPPTRIDNIKTNEHVRSTSQTLMHGGVGYHMVNWLVISTIRQALIICLIIFALTSVFTLLSTFLMLIRAILSPLYFMSFLFLQLLMAILIF